MSQADCEVRSAFGYVHLVAWFEADEGANQPPVPVRCSTRRGRGLLKLEIHSLVQEQYYVRFVAEDGSGTTEFENAETTWDTITVSEIAIVPSGPTILTEIFGRQPLRPNSLGTRTLDEEVSIRTKVNSEADRVVITCQAGVRAEEHVEMIDRCIGEMSIRNTGR